MKLEKIPKILRYCIIGTLVAFTYQGTFLLTQRLPLIYGNLIAVLLTSLVSYFGHHSITFIRKGNHKKHMSRFALQVALTYIASTAILHWILSNNYHYFYGIVMVWGFLPTIGFLIMRFWTFLEPLPIDKEI